MKRNLPHAGVSTTKLSKIDRDRQERDTEKILHFGKYRGWSMQKVLEVDPGYARWALVALAQDAKPNQQEFLEYVKEHFANSGENDDYTKDPVLRDAWYLDPRAEVLVQHDLDPSLKCVLDTAFYSGEEDIDYEEYVSLLDEYAQEHHDPHEVTFHGRFLKPEIVNAAMALREKFKENEEADEVHKLAGTPSKVISSYWLGGGGSFIGPNTATGKWTLFFNRRKENADGLTDLDVCYRVLRDKFTSAPFKVSTRRPNSNARNPRDGMLVVYCSEENRVDILNQLAPLLSLQDGKHYWKYHTNRYAKDGKVASNFWCVLRDQEVVSEQEPVAAATDVGQ